MDKFEEPGHDDLAGLRMVCEGLEKTSPRMRKATLEFAWDKYVAQPLREAARERPNEEAKQGR